LGGLRDGSGEGRRWLQVGFADIASYGNLACYP